MSAPPAPATRILCVCTGNLARSPITEGLLRTAIAECGIAGVTVASAGLHAVVGASATPKAQSVARDYGVDLSAHVARQFEKEDFERFDHIYALDGGHLEQLRDLAPKDYRGTLSLLPAPRGTRGIEVFDPFGRSRRAYARAAALIAAGVGVILSGWLERASAARVDEYQRAR
ncbi:MAG: low molecular weight phosphotyrosine protein phosphatase [Gammaproteobacteria bacterium]|nr:low molecular weight phosphotyrosine protein phosphatase [Gammaproteobacteria bacterium]